jgi:hypothetical protein
MDGLLDVSVKKKKDIEMMRNPIETVIAGLGRAGWDIHWRQLLKDHPAYRVVAVIEPLAKRRHEAEAEIGCRSYASFSDFLAAPCGELVVIATPSGGPVRKVSPAWRKGCTSQWTNRCARAWRRQTG